MTKGEGNKLGLDEAVRRRLFRFADTSSNLGLPAGDGEEWLELVGEALGNGPGEGAERLMGGDNVGVVTRWDGAGVGVEQALAAGAGGPAGAADARGTALRLIAAGRWRRDVRAGDAWVGVPIAQAYRLDLDEPNDKGKARAIVGEWIKAGVLHEVSRTDEHRKMRLYVEAVATADFTDKLSFDVLE